METAEFLLFFDKVFDSVNSEKKEDVKALRCAVKKGSPHVEFWKEAIKTLQSIKFVDAKRSVPSIKNWIFTLKGLTYLWQKLEAEKEIKYLCLRRLNQDCVENFFGVVRSHGIRNVKPTASQLAASYKSLIINNVSGNHSPGANCEADSFEILNNLRHLLLAGPQNNDINLYHIAPTPSQLPLRNEQQERMVISSTSYVSGYIAKQLLKIVRHCDVCCSKLIAADNEDFHDIINTRSYSPDSLCRPSTRFFQLYKQCISLLSRTICNSINRPNIKDNLINFLSENVEVVQLSGCISHNLPILFLTYVCVFYLRVRTSNINRILNGKNIQQYVDCENNEDDLTILAVKHFKAKRKCKN